MLQYDTLAIQYYLSKNLLILNHSKRFSKPGFKIRLDKISSGVHRYLDRW